MGPWRRPVRNGLLVVRTRPSAGRRFATLGPWSGRRGNPASGHTSPNTSNGTGASRARCSSPPHARPNISSAPSPADSTTAPPQAIASPVRGRRGSPPAACVGRDEPDEHAGLRGHRPGRLRPGRPPGEQRRDHAAVPAGGAARRRVDRMIDVNVRGTLDGIARHRPAGAAASGFGPVRHRGLGRGAHAVSPTAAVYCGTKYAAWVITEGLRQEVDLARGGGHRARRHESGPPARSRPWRTMCPRSPRIPLGLSRGLTRSCCTPTGLRAATTAPCPNPMHLWTWTFGSSGTSRPSPTTGTSDTPPPRSTSPSRR